MLAAYRRLCHKMSDDGVHIVTFTHKDIRVWRDLTAILWAAGFKVVAAWNIVTETTSGLKQGNYIQGTICLVLKKRRIRSVAGFLDEIYPLVEDEVDAQIRLMREYDIDRPDFGDTDLQIAAYAAALRVITSYDSIAGLDLRAILHGETVNSGAKDLQDLIEAAGKMATARTIPRGLSQELWRRATQAERFYLLALVAEAKREKRQGILADLAKGVGLLNWTELLASGAANEGRVCTPSEFGEARGRQLPVFDGSLLRLVLGAIARAVEGDDPEIGRLWLREELSTHYFDERNRIREYLSFLAKLPVNSMPHWAKDAAMSQRMLTSIAEESA